MVDLSTKTPVYVVRGKSFVPAYINGTLAIRRDKGICKALVYRALRDGTVKVDLLSIKSIREREFPPTLFELRRDK